MFITSGTAITPTNSTALGTRYSEYGAEGRGRPARRGPADGGRCPAAAGAASTRAGCVTVKPCLPAGLPYQHRGGARHSTPPVRWTAGSVPVSGQSGQWIARRIVRYG